MFEFECRFQWMGNNRNRNELILGQLFQEIINSVLSKLAQQFSGQKL